MRISPSPTNTFAVLVLLPYSAVITAVPLVTPVTSPVALTVATALLDELQSAVVVTSTDVPSEYKATASSCAVRPIRILAEGGLITMFSSLTVLPSLPPPLLPHAERRNDIAISMKKKTFLKLTDNLLKFKDEKIILIFNRNTAIITLTVNITFFAEK